MRKVSLLLGLVVLPCCPLRAEQPANHRAADHAKSGAASKPFNPDLAAYQRQLSDAIGRKWYEAMQAHASELGGGRVKIRFDLLPSGKVTNARVIEGLRARPRLAELSLMALLDAKLPPMPEAVQATLPKGVMEVVYTFNIK